jgi:hypothetical protein
MKAVVETTADALRTGCGQTGQHPPSYAHRLGAMGAMQLIDQPRGYRVEIQPTAGVVGDVVWPSELALPPRPQAVVYLSRAFNSAVALG